MRTIDYKKMYKEALERAKMEKEKSRNLGLLEFINETFPELKESEDERIRKSLVGHFQKFKASDMWNDEFSFENVVAWLEKQGNKEEINEASYRTGIKRVLDNPESYGLEKQGEHKSMNDIAKEVTKDKDAAISFLKSAGIMNEKGELAEQYRQDEQKPADLKTKAGNWYICDMEVVNENMVTAFHRDGVYYCPEDGYIDVGGALFEVGSLDVFRLATEKEIPQPKQNPAWSEDDERNCEWLMTVCERIHYKSDPQVAPDCALMLKDWLKSIKDRVQPKQEWSEEDKRKISDVVVALSEYANGNIPNILPTILLEDVEWLKSLRPQNRWKPSELQLGCLSDAIKHYHTLNYPATKLVELLEQLKKLKE